MTAPRIFHVPEDAAELSVVAFLRGVLGEGHDDVRRVIHSRRVQLNGNLCVDPSRQLRPRDVVKVLAHPITAPPTGRDVRIRHVDPHLLIVEKPAGMTTMRYGDEVSASGRRNRQATLLELLPPLLAAHLGTAGSQPSAPSAAKRSPRRAGGPPPGRSRSAARKERVIPVHRLDRDTSGLMVFARTAEAEQGLTAMFREHDLERTYLAVVAGAPEARTIESHLAEDRGDGQRGSVDDPALGKRAVTHVRPLEAFNGFTLVECRLETGRTHQIRIHLSEQGHPICGDRTYRKPLDERPIADRSGAPRLALHAAGLSFAHPVTGRRVSFQSPLPRDLVEFMSQLGSEIELAGDSPARSQKRAIERKVGKRKRRPR